MNIKFDYKLDIFQQGFEKILNSLVCMIPVTDLRRATWQSLLPLDFLKFNHYVDTETKSIYLLL